MVEQSHQDAFEDSRMSVGCGCRPTHRYYVHNAPETRAHIDTGHDVSQFRRDGRTYTTHIHTNVRRDRGPHCSRVFQIKLLDTIKAFA